MSPNERISQHDESRSDDWTGKTKCDALQYVGSIHEHHVDTAISRHSDMHHDLQQINANMSGTEVSHPAEGKANENEHVAERSQSGVEGLSAPLSSADFTLPQVAEGAPTSRITPRTTGMPVQGTGWKEAKDKNAGEAQQRQNAAAWSTAAL